MENLPLENLVMTKKRRVDRISFLENFADAEMKTRRIEFV